MGRMWSDIFIFPFRSYVGPDPTKSSPRATVTYKGRIINKMYNQLKPTKWGLRVYVLSDARTGYVYAFEPYYGAPTTAALIRPDLPFTPRIVVHLVAKLLEGANSGCGFHVFTDCYYTSPLLAEELLKMNVHLTGTVQGNRKGMPLQVKKGKIKLKKHESQVFRNTSKSIMVSAWHDRRTVLMLSTLYNNENKQIKRREKNKPEEVTISKPTAICDYSRNRI